LQTERQIGRRFVARALLRAASRLISTHVAGDEIR
jgi:hypothetical protein